MTIFKNLTAEEVAAQHQLLIDMLLHALCGNSDKTRETVAKAIEQMVAGYRETGHDTTILEFTLSGVRQQRALQ